MRMKKSPAKSLIAMLLASCASTGFAAIPINLEHQPASVLRPFLSPTSSRAANNQSNSLKQLRSETDLNGTTHIRVQQQYAGHAIWGADAVIHTPKGRAQTLAALMTDSSEASKTEMNGTFYSALQTDLGSVPPSFTTPSTLKIVMADAIKRYQSETGSKFSVKDSSCDLIVFVDKNNQAHWAYLVRFFAKPAQGMPAISMSIIDATTKTVYKQWNDLKTLENVAGGGVGGNEGPIGKLSYDGLPGHFPALTIQRDSATKTCYLQNNLTIVRDRRNDDTIPSFTCNQLDQQHNNIYWNSNSDYANGGYSPNDDALYSDSVVRDLYKSWFDIDMLKKGSKPMTVTMIVHDPDQGQNAYYENGEMVFGEGDNESYPVVAPSVVAHEMSHGFTEQYSNLVYSSQSGGLNESFSDMADKAVEYKVYGKNNWQIDPELLKENGRLLRWMDDPTQDCYGKKPGANCSIANMENYVEGINVHHSSGIFNKAFYLLSTSNGWNTRKAFEVMTQANRYYWTANTTFDQAACGVIKATKDYKYDVANVISAMKAVGVNTRQC